MQLQQTPSGITSSGQRPIPLRGRDDLVVEWISYKGIKSPVIKDPCGLKYYRLQAEQYAVLRLLNAKRSLEDIRDGLQQQFPTEHVALADVQYLIQDLHDKGLLVSERSGQGISLIRIRRERFRQSVLKTIRNPLYLRLPGWDPDRTLTKMMPYTRWLFHPITVWLAFALMGVSLLFLSMRFDELQKKLPEFQQFFAWPNLVYLWMTMIGAKICHEFGHGLTCKHFGGECHSMGVMLLVFSPTLYCDVTDSWMMKNKWHRIYIGAAGMYIEMILSSVAIFMWWNTRPGLMNHLCLNLFFISAVTTIIFNANPLLRYDGYYMLSDYLEIPNMQQKASQLFQKTFGWWCLGIEVREDPFMPRDGRPWFVAYTVAAAAYRWVVTFGIVTFLYTVLKPYRLQTIGIMMAVFSLGGILFGMGYNLYKLLVMPRLDPISRPKLAITLTLLGLFTLGALLLPFPWWIDAPFYIEPLGVHNVYARESGIIESTRFQTIAAAADTDVQQVAFQADADDVTALPDDPYDLQAGDIIMQLRSPEIQEKLQDLAIEYAAQQADLDKFDSLRQVDQAKVAEQNLANLDEQIAQLHQRQSQLAISSPGPGQLVEPTRVPRPKLEKMKEQLPQWNGVPFRERNLGAFIQEGTQVASIAPPTSVENGVIVKYQAVILISQENRNDFERGLEQVEVRMKLDSQPGEVLNATVPTAEISRRHSEFAPRALSNKFGGSLPTVTDQEQREKLTIPVYQVNVPIPVDPQLVCTGMRGQARIIVTHRSLGGWIWRYLRNTFMFRL